MQTQSVRSIFFQLRRTYIYIKLLIFNNFFVDYFLKSQYQRLPTVTGSSARVVPSSVATLMSKVWEMVRRRVLTSPKNGLTTPFIRGLKRAAQGEQYEITDLGETRNLRTRVSSRSKKFYMTARWHKGAASATPRLIGNFVASKQEEDGGSVTLAKARDIARGWERSRQAGTDPRAEQQRPPDAGALAGTTPSFKDMVKAYLAQTSFKGQRQSKASERAITREILDPERNKWVNKPAFEIDVTEIAE